MTAPLPAMALVPCPFCGADSPMVFEPTCNRRSKYNPTDRAAPVVRCLSCYAEAFGEDWDATCRTAIAAWNRRHVPAEAVERVARAICRVVAADPDEDEPWLYVGEAVKRKRWMAYDDAARAAIQSLGLTIAEPDKEDA